MNKNKICIDKIAHKHYEFIEGSGDRCVSIKTRYRVTWYVRTFLMTWNERLSDTFDTAELAEDYANKLETWATTKQCKKF